MKSNSSIEAQDCEEITMIEYKGSSAVEFIILAMIKCWEAPLEIQAVIQEVPKLEQDLFRQPSKVEKDLYLLPSLPYQEEEKEKEKAKAAAAKKPEPPKEEPKIAKTCPIFNPACVGVGISNKAHPSQKNVIQMLFTKAKINVID